MTLRLGRSPPLHYLFTACFKDGSVELGGGDAWAALRILRLKREKGGFTLSAIIDQRTGKVVTEDDLRRAVTVTEAALGAINF